MAASAKFPAPTPKIGRDPSLLFTQRADTHARRRDLLDIVAQYHLRRALPFRRTSSLVRPHGLQDLAPIPATTSVSRQKVSLIDALANDQLRRNFVHRPSGTFFPRWRARYRYHHSPSLAGRVNRAGWRAPSTGAALPPASLHSLRQPQNHSTGALVHIQSGFLVVSYSGSHEASSLRTLAFRWRARDPANRALRSKDAFSPYAEPGYYSWQGRSFTRRSAVTAREPLPPARRRRREGPAVVR
jgi:hypothetical protein